MFTKVRNRRKRRVLRFEGLERRLPLAADLDDQMSEAILLDPLSTTPKSVDASITTGDDVDMYRFTVATGQVVDFDIDTTLNGPGGLGSYLRLFDSRGLELAFNNDALAPGEIVVGFDAYLRYTFARGGTYFLGVSNANNITYNPVRGDRDVAGGLNATGNYRLTVQVLPVDPDDSLSEATNLGALSTTPKTIDSTISPDIDVDIYRFTATAGQTVDFDIDTTRNGPGGLGSYLRLLNPLGQQLAVNNDGLAPGDSTVGFDAYLRHTFTTSGTYYIAVSNANNTQYNPLTGSGDTAGGPHSIGDYQLIVQALPVDTDDATSEATSLGRISTTPTTVGTTIATDIDVDMYRFTVSGGQVVDFDIDTVQNGPGGLGSFIRLFDAQGQQLAVNNDGAAPGENVVGFDAYLRFTFSTGGTYFLGVSNANNTLYDPVTGNGDTAGGFNSVGAYQLIVQTPTVAVADPDDGLSEATVLNPVSTVPQQISAGITPDTDVDMYRFSVTSGQIVDFDIDTAQNGPGGLGSYIRLFNAQGQQLAFNNDAAAPGENVPGFDAYLRHTFTVGGTYYLGVSNANNTLYDPVTGNGDTAGGLNATGNYQLIVQALPVDPDDALTEATLIDLAAPATINAAIAPDVDVDMYRFTAAAGQIIDFDIDTVQNGPGGLGSYIRLFNAQGQQLAFSNDAAAPGETAVGFDAYLRYTFPARATYYLGVSNSNNIQYDPLTGGGDTAGGIASTGDYQLIVQIAPTAPADPDDTLTEATFAGQVTTTARTFDASISPDVDVDMYRFAIAAGQVVDFDIDTAQNGPGGLGSYIRLFNVQGQQLAFNNDGLAPGESAVGFDAYLRYTFAAAGTYYLGVSNVTNSQYNPSTGAGDVPGGANATGNYSLTVQALPVDTDDSFLEATSLGAISSAARTVNAALVTDIDVNMYRFTVAAGQIVGFDIDTPINGPGGLGSYLRLFNAQGLQLAFNNDGVAPGETVLGFDAYLRHVFTVGGTYFLGVSNANNTQYNGVTGTGDTAGGLHSIGAYRLIVQAVPTVGLQLTNLAVTAPSPSSPGSAGNGSVRAAEASRSDKGAAGGTAADIVPGTWPAGSRSADSAVPAPRARGTIDALDDYFARLGSGGEI